MPKQPIDYSKTIIYKIEHIDDDSLVYVGHTTNWDKRKISHKYYCNNENNLKHNLKVYQMIRENGGWNSFKMLEVEKYPCNDKREAEKRETEVMKVLKSNMNTYKSFITQVEMKERNKKNQKAYCEKNKEIIQGKKNKYYEKNKHHINEKIECKCGYETYKKHLKRHQQSIKHIEVMKNFNF